MKFNEQLIAARKAAGMTQEQLADAVHVARNTVSSWENDRRQPDLDTLRQLSQILKYDFINDKPLEAEVSTPVQVAESFASPEIAADAPSEAEPAAPAKKKFPVWILAVALAVIAAVVVLVVTTSKPKYQEKSARLTCLAEKDPVYLVKTDTFNGGEGFPFGFFTINESDVPFIPDQVVCKMMDAAGNLIGNIELGYEEFKPWLSGRELRNTDENAFYINFGSNNPALTDVTFMILGKDALGNDIVGSTSLKVIDAFEEDVVGAQEAQPADAAPSEESQPVDGNAA